jgi:hypothetical protein
LVFFPKPDIHFAILKHNKNTILFFLENTHEKPLAIGRMHENKTYIFFMFSK